MFVEKFGGIGMIMAICVSLCCNERIVIVCCKFGGIGMKMAICVFLCSDECIVSDCCKFGGIGMIMAICVYFCVPMNALRVIVANLVE